MANPLMSKTLQAKLAEMMKNRSGGPRTDDPRPSNNNGNKSNPTNRRKIPYALKDCVMMEIDGKLCFQIETKQHLHLVLCGFFPDRSDIQVSSPSPVVRIPLYLHLSLLPCAVRLLSAWFV
jgi:hypothetical protein